MKLGIGKVTMPFGTNIPGIKVTIIGDPPPKEVEVTMLDIMNQVREDPIEWETKEERDLEGKFKSLSMWAK